MSIRHAILSCFFAASIAAITFYAKPAKAEGADEACAAIMCLAPYVGMGTDGGPACKAPKEIYFNIRVFDPWSGFDPELTSKARWAFLSSCPDAMNKATATAENETIGRAFDAP